ncbi:J domain-containing protein [Hymenobacter fastidiosus]|uniref:J domain-containing protein n=1 Tax=Hymenobacter fastidiosus TaxID=486264 RepID=A0ABP7RPH7_9BACT
MAKKTAATASQLVHIQAPGMVGSSLSKAQKEFNRLTKRIQKLEQDVADFRAAADRLRQRVQTEYRPLQTQHNDQRAALVRHLDRAHDTYKLTKTERAKIVDLIVQGCHDLPDRGYTDLQPILDKYAPPLSEEAGAEADLQISEMMKQLYTQQFGIEFDPAVDVSTKEKFGVYVEQKLAEQEAEYVRQEEEQAARRAQRKKSPKQQAAEAKKQAEEKNITKSVRTLYMDLVKALHPDREPDEAEKARKTVLLQKVTAAYEANELLTLLRLQLELQHIDQSHLENLAEDQLSYYNKLLREQARELDQAMYEEQLNVSDFSGQPYYMLSTAAALDYDYQRQKLLLEAKIRQLAANVLAFEHDPAALKAFLKAYRIPKAGPGALFRPL